MTFTRSDFWTFVFGITPSILTAITQAVNSSDPAQVIDNPGPFIQTLWGGLAAAILRYISSKNVTGPSL